MAFVNDFSREAVKRPMTARAVKILLVLLKTAAHSQKEHFKQETKISLGLFLIKSFPRIQILH